MKKFLSITAVIIIIYVVIYDFKIGTLPQSAPTKTTGIIYDDNKQNKQTFQSYEVKPGDTLISIVEQINEKSPSVMHMIIDFKQLNPGSDPEKLHLGKTYKFPIYPSQR